MEGINLLRAVLSACLLTVVFAQEFPGQVPELPTPIIKSLNIHSNIKYTYAKTLVSSRILNPAEKAQEVNFKVILPEEAFITGLVMTIKGKSYDAYVKGKEEAKKDYDAAVSSGQGAAHVFQDNTRNSKDFTVAVNVEAQEKVSFNLTYEELLSRKNKTYKNEINVNPHQLVKDLSIVVDIEDVLDVINVLVPNFKSNDIELNDGENESAKKTVIAPNKVRVEWNPTIDEQTKLNKNGLNGQMLVKYDIDASKSPQQILVDNDGYFVHILRSDDLPVLNKHVVFVLDVSGSMHGQKMAQLRDAMKKILQDLSEEDSFSIVLFSVAVVAWGPNVDDDMNHLNSFDDSEPANVIAKDDYVVPATKENIEKALEFVKTINDYGGTNIMGGLRNGLKLAKLGQDLHNNSATPIESMVIFLTDGQPNSEESNPQKIIANVEKQNNGVTIFSLGFGSDADINFLKRLSLANNGFARRIYAESDASIQLTDFYKEVATPVLSNVKFEYLPDQVENTTSEGFKNLFSGSDLIVLGKLKSQGKVSGDLVANSKKGLQRFAMPPVTIIVLPDVPIKNATLGYLEKMWAFKTIKTLLDKNTVSKNESIENKAKDLALKYSFVTPLTSLVVVKPNESAVVDDEESKRLHPSYSGVPLGFGVGASGFGGVSFRQKVHLQMAAPILGGRHYLQISSPRVSSGPQFGAGASGFPAPQGQFQYSPSPVNFMHSYTHAAPVPRPPASPPGFPSYPPPQGFGSAGIPGSAGDKGFAGASGFPGPQGYPPLTTPRPGYVHPMSSGPHQVVHYSKVSWLNQTVSEDGLFLQPPISLGTDVISLNQTDIQNQTCINGNNCRHFIYCVLDEFVDDVTKFIPYQCHIDPKFLGVCCPV